VMSADAPLAPLEATDWVPSSLLHLKYGEPVRHASTDTRPPMETAAALENLIGPSLKTLSIAAWHLPESLQRAISTKTARGLRKLQLTIQKETSPSAASLLFPPSGGPVFRCLEVLNMTGVSRVSQLPALHEAAPMLRSLSLEESGNVPGVLEGVLRAVMQLRHLEELMVRGISLADTLTSSLLEEMPRTPVTQSLRSLLLLSVECTNLGGLLRLCPRLECLQATPSMPELGCLADAMRELPLLRAYLAPGDVRSIAAANTELRGRLLMGI
jgi:hypothetical protein